jgi:hypothetical protein
MLYTAIIIEPRQHKALPFVLENFLNNLSEDWSFIIFHGINNLEFIIDIINDKLSKHIHRIKLMNLNVNNLTINNYNNLLKYNKNFYHCIPTETFLIFQTDTILIKKYNHLINDFLHYDYVGAPWNHFPLNNNERVGNGGLSLRKKSKMIEIMEKQGKSDYPEDVYFSCYDSIAIHKPSVNDAMFFSIEEIFSEMSFGCHKPWKNSNQLFLYETYDEVKQLYNYNDIPIPLPNPEPAIPPPKPKPLVVAPVIPPPKPELAPAIPPPKPKPLVIAPAIPPPKPKPLVVAPAIPPPKPKPLVVALAIPPPKTVVVIDSNPKGYKIARMEKDKLKDIYNYNSYKHNVYSSNKSRQPPLLAQLQLPMSSKNNAQEEDATNYQINLTSLSLNFQNKFKYK